MKNRIAAIAALASAFCAAGDFVHQFPEKVFYARGGAEATVDGATLRYGAGGEQPVVAYDYGPQCAGGYAIVDVKGFKGMNPVLRLSYSTHPDGLRETGDFTRRGCADYLGPTFDNPVLPANVNRFELYTITRTGTYIAPLIQGQERYVRVQLETPGTEVELGALEIRNVGVFSLERPAGYFKCSDERVDRAWDMSAWTCQIASFPNGDAWRTVDGRLLPRKLENGSPVGLCERVLRDGDGIWASDFELRTNPHFNSAMGLLLRANDEDNGIIVVASQPAFVQILRRRGGVNTVLRQKIVDEPIVDGVKHRLEVVVSGVNVAVHFDGKRITDVDVPDIGLGGRCGIYTEKEWWPVVENFVVCDGAGNEIYRDDFSGSDDLGRLDGWSYTRAFRYMADGAKRDRLVWIGDLWWAQRTCFYAYDTGWPYFRESLRLLAFNQTPEGYIWAAPRAETRKRPASGEYGHFPSDEFSAWFVPIVWDFYLHNGDEELAREFYPAVKKDLEYLISHCRDDGIFVQRIETSSHACSMPPADPRTRFYMQALLNRCYLDGASLADALGFSGDAARWRERAARLGESVRREFLREDGHFADALEYESDWYRDISEKFALGAGFYTPAEARAAAGRVRRDQKDKFHLAGLRGMFAYGFDEEAFEMLANGAWFGLSDPSWPGAHCCTECGFMTTDGWWDESHPDTAVAGPITNYLLGVEPLEPGFVRWSFAPHVVAGLDFAEGGVPTPHGTIFARWERKDGGIAVALEVPEGTVAVCGGEELSPGRRELFLAR